jgi:hypothetical protein
MITDLHWLKPAFGQRLFLFGCAGELLCRLVVVWSVRQADGAARNALQVTIGKGQLPRILPTSTAHAERHSPFAVIWCMFLAATDSMYLRDTYDNLGHSVLVTFQLNGLEQGRDQKDSKDPLYFVIAAGKPVLMAWTCCWPDMKDENHRVPQAFRSDNLHGSVLRRNYSGQ